MENLFEEVSVTDRNTQDNNSVKCCDFCGSKEGDLRKVGNYVVTLIPISVSGSIKQACQSCSRKHWAIKDYFIKAEQSAKKRRFW